MSIAYPLSFYRLQGQIPRNLHGTLLRNGPGNYEYGKNVRRHPFDGDGLVCSFAFKDGQVIVRQKFVRTEALVQELTQGVLVLPLLHFMDYMLQACLERWSLQTVAVRMPCFGSSCCNRV